MLMRKRNLIVERLEGRRLLAVAATPLASQFEGVEQTTTGDIQRPDCALAVGPDDIMTVNNSSIEWYGKDGTLQHQYSLRGFVGVDGIRAYDPEVFYDA